MSAQEKIRCAMAMLRVVECHQLSHREKTVLVQIAYDMLRDGLNTINKYVLNETYTPF